MCSPPPPPPAGAIWAGARPAAASAGAAANACAAASTGAAAYVSPVAAGLALACAGPAAASAAGSVQAPVGVGLGEAPLRCAEGAAAAVPSQVASLGPAGTAPVARPGGAGLATGVPPVPPMIVPPAVATDLAASVPPHQRRGTGPAARYVNTFAPPPAPHFAPAPPPPAPPAPPC